MTTADMGPLPESDHNAELQRTSIKALNALLKSTDLSVLRELLSLELPLHYRIHPKELAVLMPARHEPAEAQTAAQKVKPR